MTEYYKPGEFAQHLEQMAKADAEKAERDQRPPEDRCCFGIAYPERRCKNKAVMAATFYGFTHGLSWCAEHAKGDRLDRWPHGTKPTTA